jgi:hypothetical protein
MLQQDGSIIWGQHVTADETIRMFLKLMHVFLVSACKARCPLGLICVRRGKAQKGTGTLEVDVREQK